MQDRSTDYLLAQKQQVLCSSTSAVYSTTGASKDPSGVSSLLVSLAVADGQHEHTEKCATSFTWNGKSSHFKQYNKRMRMKHSYKMPV